MAQTNFTPIYLYNSGMANNTPLAANLGAGELAINYTDGKLFYKDNNSAIQVIGWKTTPTTAGGTGLISYTTGDLPYYASGTTLSKLGIGTSGYVLESNGSAPTWVAQSTLSVGTATNATNTAITNNTSSSATWYPTIVSATTGNLQQTTSSTKLSFVPSTGTLTATSYAGAWAGSTIGTGYGGTGLTSFTANGIVYASNTSALATGSALQFDGTNLGLGVTPSASARLQSYTTSSGATAFLSTSTNGLVNGKAGYFIIGNNSGGSGGGYGIVVNDRTDNSGGAQAGYGIYTSAPYDGTNASGNTYALVRYGLYVDDLYSYYGKNSGTGAYNWGLYVKGGGLNYFAAPVLCGYTSSNGAYQLQVNSQIFATSSTIATSDANYKTNVIPLTNSLKLVNSLNPVTFNWKPHPIHNFDTVNTTTGFLAQEVQQAMADLPFVNSIIKKNICVLKEQTPTTEAVTEDFLGIAEGNMIAILTSAIQELSAKFDAYVASHP